MIFHFQSESKVGPISYGMDRDEVRIILNSPFDEFKKTESSLNTIDAFDRLGVHLFYCENDRVKGLEIFSPVGQLEVAGCELLGSAYPSLLELMDEKKISYEEDELGATLEGGVIALYVPSKDYQHDAKVEAAYVTLKQS